MAHNSINRVIKLEKVDCELEGARQKLDGALQFLVDKAEESSSSSDESLKNLDIVVKQEDLDKITDVMTPLRRTIRRPGRKRKSRDDYSLKNSYILKLFDRSVDLAQFGAETPLYPVCRAWIRNKPRRSSPGPSNRHSRSPSPRPLENEVNEDSQDDSSDVNRNIYQLPLPTPLPKKYHNKSPRIPSPIPKENKELLVSSSDEAPAPETLLTDHLIRWRVVRQKWKDSAARNEERYRQSTNILKTMFENAFPKDLPETNDQWTA